MAYFYNIFQNQKSNCQKKRIQNNVVQGLNYTFQLGLIRIAKKIKKLYQIVLTKKTNLQSRLIVSLRFEILKLAQNTNKKLKFIIKKFNLPVKITALKNHFKLLYERPSLNLNKTCSRHSLLPFKKSEKKSNSAEKKVTSQNLDSSVKNPIGHLDLKIIELEPRKSLLVSHHQLKQAPQFVTYSTNKTGRTRRK